MPKRFLSISHFINENQKTHLIKTLCLEIMPNRCALTHRIKFTCKNTQFKMVPIK